MRPADHVRRLHAEAVGVGLVREQEPAVAIALRQDHRNVIGHGLEPLALAGGRSERGRAALLRRLQFLPVQRLARVRDAAAIRSSR